MMVGFLALSVQSLLTHLIEMSRLWRARNRHYKIRAVVETFIFYQLSNLYKTKVEKQVTEEMVVVSCKICGKQINRKPSALKNKSGFSFFSLSCAGKYGATLTPQKKRSSPSKTLKQKVTDRAYWVSSDHRPLNPIAREAWDRRVQAGEIHEYSSPTGQTA